MAGGKFSLANLFGVTIRESANDGSDFTNPDADYRRLFLGEDGLLHVKDSAGTVTSPYTGGGGITRTTQGTTSAGASFVTRGMYLKKLTLATDGDVREIHAFIKASASANITIVPVVYTDVAGAPTNLIFAPMPLITSTPTLVYNMQINTTVRDYRMPGPGWLPAGDYWFGLWMTDNAGTTGQLASTATGGTGATVAGGTQNQPMDSSLQAITTNSVDYSIYIGVQR